MSESRKLTSNVFVDEVWYGPSYPQNEPTSEVLDKIDNPAAYAEVEPFPFDLRYTASDYGTDPGDQPHLRSVEEAVSASLVVTPVPLPPPLPVPDVPSVADVASPPEAKPAKKAGKQPEPLPGA